MFKTSIFLSVLCTVVFEANSLHCYVCYDCDKVSDDYVTSCDTLVSTTSSSSSTTPTTTTSTSPSTTTSTESTTTSSTTTTSTTTTTESTTTTTTPTTTTTTTTTTEAPQSRVSSFADHLERANTTWECFNGIASVNGSDVIVRGCAAGHTNETCEVFGLKSCSFCSTDKCNAAGSIQASVAVVAVMLFTYLVKEF